MKKDYPPHGEAGCCSQLWPQATSYDVSITEPEPRGPLPRGQRQWGWRVSTASLVLTQRLSVISEKGAIPTCCSLFCLVPFACSSGHPLLLLLSLNGLARGALGICIQALYPQIQTSSQSVNHWAPNKHHCALWESSLVCRGSALDLGTWVGEGCNKLSLS